MNANKFALFRSRSIQTAKMADNPLKNTKTRFHFSSLEETRGGRRKKQRHTIKIGFKIKKKKKISLNFCFL